MRTAANSTLCKSKIICDHEVCARLKNIHGSDWDWDLASVGVVHHGNLLSPRPDVSLQSHLFMMTEVIVMIPFDDNGKTVR